MRLVRATYVRQHLDGSDEAIALSADVIQDGGEHSGSELCVVWTDECLVTLAAAELDMEELVGATEALEEAYWASEREECRLASVRQRAAEKAVA